MHMAPATCSMAQPYAVLTLASIANAVISGPLAAGLLSLQGAAGLAGWQWLFIIEAVPTIMLGVAMAVSTWRGPCSSAAHNSIVAFAVQLEICQQATAVQELPSPRPDTCGTW